MISMLAQDRRGSGIEKWLPRSKKGSVIRPLCHPDESHLEPAIPQSNTAGIEIAAKLDLSPGFHWGLDPRERIRIWTAMGRRHNPGLMIFPA